jgi:hypothetical protein
MEFLDINLTKDSSLLPRTIHSPFYCRILQKAIFFSGFKNPHKKNPRKQENSMPFKNSISGQNLQNSCCPVPMAIVFLHGPTRSTYIHTHTVKGSLIRDIKLQVFFMNQFPPGL